MMQCCAHDYLLRFIKCALLRSFRRIFSMKIFHFLFILHLGHFVKYRRRGRMGVHFLVFYGKVQ